MTNAIDALSTSAPPIATHVEGDTAVFAAFRCWAETVRWCESAPWSTDATNDWRACQITRCEREMARLTPIDARDLACLAWVALAGVTLGASATDCLGIDDEAHAALPPFIDGVKALHPDIAAIVASFPGERVSQ